MRLFALAVCLSVVCGCSNDRISNEVVGRTDFGRINSIRVLEGSVFRAKGVVIYCTNGVIVISRSGKKRIPVIPFKTKCSIVELANGLKYFTWRGSKRMYRCE